MRGIVQSEIFGVPPFGPHFGHGRCHKHFGPNFMELKKIAWLLHHGHHGFKHGHGKHHGHHGHHDHHGHRGHHGHHGHHGHRGHHGHHGHKGHHCSRKLRSPSPDCHYGPRFASPGHEDRSPSRGPNMPEDSSPDRRGCEGFRRKDKWSRGSKRRGPCGRSPYDSCPPRISERPCCCKKSCEKKQNEHSGNENNKANDSVPNCTENTNDEAVLYERVVVENIPRGSSV